MKTEVWKDIPDYEGIYQCSNLGNIKSLNYNRTNKEQILKLSITNGYYKITLLKNSKLTNYYVHQLVAMIFLNHTPNKHLLVVNHIDFNKFNNDSDNLEIISTRDNTNRKHCKSRSIYTGVSWDNSANKWKAQMFLDHKTVNLGRFKTEKEASDAYQEKLFQLM